MTLSLWDHSRLRARILNGVEADTNGGCWLWAGTIHSTGYGEMGIGQKPHNRVHRISYEVFCAPVPTGVKVLHRCDVRACCNPAHLFLGSQSDNVRDMISKGRARYSPVRGSDNAGSRLSELQVGEIRTSSESSRQLAARLPVTASMVRRIRRGQAWSHLLPVVTKALPHLQRQQEEDAA